MHNGKQTKSSGDDLRLSRTTRVLAAAIFCGIATFAVFANWAGRHNFSFIKYTGVCGFKDRYGLPCPTCGMTTSWLQFAQGHVLKAFIAQPAGPILFTALIAAGVWSFVLAITGHKPPFARNWRLKYIILGIFGIVLAGWAVMLVRAM
jgi:hypothetical protein